MPSLPPRMRHHPLPPYMRRSAPWTCTTTAARTSRTPSGCGGGHRGARARGRRRPVGHVPGRAREALTAQRSPARLPPGPAQSCPGRCATLTAPCRAQANHSVRRRPARPVPARPAPARVVPSCPCGQPMPEGCGIGGRLGAPGGEVNGCHLRVAPTGEMMAPSGAPFDPGFTGLVVGASVPWLRPTSLTLPRYRLSQGHCRACASRVVKGGGYSKATA